jgi:hypothetical protein
MKNKTPPHSEKRSNPNTRPRDNRIITVVQHSLEKETRHQFFTISQTNPTTSKHHDQPHQIHQVDGEALGHLAYAELSKQQAHHSKFSSLQGRGSTGPNPQVSNNDTSTQA